MLSLCLLVVHISETSLLAEKIMEHLSVSLIALVLKDVDGRAFVALCSVQYNLINNSRSFTLCVCYQY